MIRLSVHPARLRNTVFEIDIKYGLGGIQGRLGSSGSHLSILDVSDMPPLYDHSKSD